MKTTTLLAGAMALAIGATLAGVELVQSQQLGTGDSAIGRRGEALGAGDAATDEAGSRGNQQAVAPAAAGVCVTNRTAFRTQTNYVSTTSTSFVVMPNTLLPITTSGGCLIVDFSGEVANSNLNNNYQIRAVIGGIGTAQPPNVFLGRPVVTNVLEARSMRFVFPNVPAGTHTVRIDYRSINGGTVAAEFRTLTIQYRP